VSFAIANGAALNLSGFRFDTKYRRKLSINFFSLGDQLFHARDLGLDVHVMISSFADPLGALTSISP
jgi:hypothetical protein